MGRGGSGGQRGCGRGEEGRGFAVAWTERVRAWERGGRREGWCAQRRTGRIALGEARVDYEVARGEASATRRDEHAHSGGRPTKATRRKRRDQPQRQDFVVEDGDKREERVHPHRQQRAARHAEASASAAATAPRGRVAIATLCVRLRVCLCLHPICVLQPAHALLHRRLRAVVVHERCTIGGARTATRATGTSAALGQHSPHGNERHGREQRTDGVR